MTPNARSPADSGCSLSDPCRRTLRPNLKFKLRHYVRREHTDCKGGVELQKR